MNLLYPCEDPDGGHLRSLDRKREVMQVVRKARADVQHSLGFGGLGVTGRQSMVTRILGCQGEETLL